MTAALTLLIALAATVLVKLIMLPVDLLSWVHLPLWVTLGGLFLLFAWSIGDH